MKGKQKLEIDYKKLITGGFIVGIIIWLLGLVFGALSSDLYIMSPKVFWKPMDSGWMTQMITLDFITAFILAFAFEVFKSAIPGEEYQKGLAFGLIVFLVGPFLGLSMTYITMALREKLIIMWGLNSLINYCLAGLTFQFIDDRVK